MADSVAEMDDPQFEAFVPQLRPDAVARDFDGEIVAWSSLSHNPTYLNPVGALIYRLVDGRSSVGEYLADICEIVGIPSSVASSQLRSVLSLLESDGLLATSTPAQQASSSGDVFSGPLNT